MRRAIRGRIITAMVAGAMLLHGTTVAAVEPVKARVDPTTDDITGVETLLP